MQKFAVFRISDEVFGIPIERVVEIIKLQKVFTVPGLPDFLSGVMNVRGLVIPLIDLRKRFGTGPSGKKERIIVVRFEQEKLGFLVDEVKDILSVSAQEMTKPPSIFKGFKTEYIMGLGRKDGNIIIILNIDNLLTSEERIMIKESINMIGEEVAGPDKQA